MTEEDAKTKTCCGPLPVLAGILITTNPQAKDQPVPKCIGSACMAWRWGQKPNPDWKPGQMAMSWDHPAHQQPSYVRDETWGGCGLAGAPQ